MPSKSIIVFSDKTINLDLSETLKLGSPLVHELYLILQQLSTICFDRTKVGRWENWPKESSVLQVPSRLRQSNAHLLNSPVPSVKAWRRLWVKLGCGWYIFGHRRKRRCK